MDTRIKNVKQMLIEAIKEATAGRPTLTQCIAIGKKIDIHPSRVRQTIFEDIDRVSLERLLGVASGLQIEWEFLLPEHARGESL